MMILNIVTFLCIHWLFTSHYLQVAVLFRVITVSHTTMEDLDSMYRRKKFLHALDLIVYTAFLGVAIYFIAV